MLYEKIRHGRNGVYLHHEKFHLIDRWQRHQPRPFHDTRPRHWFARHIIQLMIIVDKGSQHSRLLLNRRMRVVTSGRGLAEDGVLQYGTGPCCSHSTDAARHRDRFIVN